jgi:hypothetical protein
MAQFSRWVLRRRGPELMDFVYNSGLSELRTPSEEETKFMSCVPRGPTSLVRKNTNDELSRSLGSTRQQLRETERPARLLPCRSSNDDTAFPKAVWASSPRLKGGSDHVHLHSPLDKLGVSGG